MRRVTSATRLREFSEVMKLLKVDDWEVIYTDDSVHLACERSIYLAGCGRFIWPLLGADHQGLSCGFDDFWGDGVQLVDLQDTADLAHESFDEPEVAA